MQEFWAMSDLSKLILVLKILLVGYGWGMLIFSSLLIILLTVDYLKMWIREWREERAYKKHKKFEQEQLLVYSQNTVELPRPRYPHWANQDTDAFKFVEEISK